VAPSCAPGTKPSGSAGSSGSSGDAGSGASDCPEACSGSTPVCDAETKTCVGCLPSENTCGDGASCDAETKTCVSGCSTDDDCSAPLICDTATSKCVSCIADVQCEPGFICGSNGQCVTGCNDSQPCTVGLVCCGGTCADIAGDPKSCGACDTPCPDLEGATESCTMGMCGLEKCDDGYADCNLDAADGCEWDINVFGACSCKPGETQECYTGAPGTKGVGTCTAGTSTCDPSGANWGPCMGEVTPKFDACADALDNDCDGTPDNAKDLDGDGWTPCDGDCCDIVEVGVCGDPALVNPGAYEVGGNMVDDDCDLQVDNVLAACDSGLATSSNTATDYAKAIDLCPSTTANPPLKDKRWGVVSAKLSLADGNGAIAAQSKSIRTGFGTNVKPLGGASLAVLSTGNAADSGDSNPPFASFQMGADKGTFSDFPDDWLMANLGNLPNAPGCPEPTGNTANDPAMLTVTVRVPTNAKSFSVSSFFYSAEFPEWTCSAFNDFFVTLLDSAFVPGAGQSPNPADKNLAFYDPPPAGAPFYPVGVNLAFGGTGLFNQCQNGPTGCELGTVSGNINTCTGTNLLTGTGFDQTSAAEYYCSSSAKFVGGGTGWLTTNGNVKPGETITLRFAVWDTSDHVWDSLVLIDNFQWSVDASTPGTHE
jgi:hypothetical protein